MTSAGEVLADRYRLERRVGEGGMGAVWAAQHVMTHKRVAVKVLKADIAASDHARHRFEREVQASCALDHPAVVPVHDAFVDDGAPVIVMDLLSGETLRARLERCGALTVEETASTLIPIVEALAEAHAKGFAHRDLKPDNVYITEGDGPKLLDFGLAKLLGERAQDAALQTRVGVMLGTPAYMAPEQAKGAATVDHRVDVWALGVILYRCLSGMQPIEGDSAAEILARLATDAITPLEVIDPGLPAALTELVGRMLSRDPDGRPHDLAEVLAVLRSLARAEATKTAAPAPGGNISVTVPGAPPAAALQAAGRTRRSRLVWVALSMAAIGAIAASYVIAQGTGERSNTQDDAAAPPRKPREASKDEPREGPGVAAGRPPGVLRGPGGVFLWRDRSGVWQLRVVAKRKGGPIGGAIVALDGPIEEVERQRLEAPDEARHEGQTLRFAFVTVRDGDGLSWRAPGCIRFDAEMRGTRRPELVRVGRRGVRPTRMPFVVCADGASLRYE